MLRIYFKSLFGNDFSREQDNDINAHWIMGILINEHVCA